MLFHLNYQDNVLLTKCKHFVCVCVLTVSSGSVTVNADSSVQLLAEEAVPLDQLDISVSTVCVALHSAACHNVEGSAVVLVNHPLGSFVFKLGDLVSQQVISPYSHNY